MILHAVELTYVGRFRETVELRPFDRGLTILAAPNEAGKSTVLRAVARTLFDKHTTRSDEIKSLQPAGTDLAPRVAVEFETAAGRYRIEKTFLQSPRSLLKQWQAGAWQPLAEADVADRRVQELLQSTLPGRGATRPEHWGFLGFLWARQDEPVAWPTLDDEAVGQRIRAKLARVEIDPAIEALRLRLAEEAGAIFTSTGQSKVGGPLRAAEDTLGSIENELVQLRLVRGELEAAQQKFENANAQVAIRETEHRTLTAAAAAAGDRALAVERMRGELDTRTAELSSAREKLHALTADARQVEQRTRELATARSDFENAEGLSRAAETGLLALRQKLDRRLSERPALETTWNAARAVHRRLQDLLKSRDSLAHAASLAAQVQVVAATAAQIETLQKVLSRIPHLTAARVRTLEENAETARTLEAQLEAVGLRVELTPERDSTVSLSDGSTTRNETLPAGKTSTHRSAHGLEVSLVGWGRIVVRSGAKETQTLAQGLVEASKRLQESLAAEGVVTLEGARDALQRRKELAAQIAASEPLLKEQLGKHTQPAALRDAASGAALRAEALARTLQPTAAESAASRTQLDTEEARAAEDVPASERALKAADLALSALRVEEREAATAAQKTTQAVHAHALRVRTLESQLAEIDARYPDGLESAKTAVQLAFAEMDARVTLAKSKLPVDFEKLPDRNRRAAGGLQQLTHELQDLRADRDRAKGALETLGGQGLYSRETDLEERKAEATLRRDAARTLGWATRIAHDLIEYRKHAATRAVLLPLEQRLGAAFAELTGVRGRQVFLEENLQIAGIGFDRGSAHRFDLLSQGAKEQLVLCLRIAVAQELAVTEPQVLILDDVLVNTDQTRQIRILEVLTSLAKDLQIIVLTCHSDRYREATHRLSLPL